MGNGGAMRSAPIGAFYRDDYAEVVDAAKLSAEVTHAHREGIAGAISVAVAAAWAARGESDVASLFDTVVEYTPAGETKDGVVRAAELDLNSPVPEAAGVLGNGASIISQDTVPFTLWCAARHLDSFEEAMWATVSGMGDRDTTCAIVGGILGARPGIEVPASWIDAREPLENMSLM